MNLILFIYFIFANGLELQTVALKNAVLSWI